MRSTSVPRSGFGRVPTAPPARTGLASVATAAGRSVGEGESAVTEAGLLRPGSAPARAFDQVLLHVQQRPALLVGGEGDPAAVGLQLPGGGALVEGDVEQLGDLRDVGR